MLGIAAIYSSIIGITQTMTNSSIGGLFYFLGERTFTISTPGISTTNFSFDVLRIAYRVSPFHFLRPYATFSHPNVLAGFLAGVLLLTFGKKKWNALNITTMILSVITVLLCMSRITWIATSIGLFSILFDKWKNHDINKKIVLPLFGIFMLVGIFIGLPYIYEASQNTENITIRNELGSQGISMLTKNPIYLFTGIGLGNFLVNLPTYLPGIKVATLQPIHNIYLYIIVETGLIGLAMILWVISSSIKKSIKMKNLPLTITIVTILSIGLFDHYLLSLQQGLLLLTLTLSLPYTKAFPIFFERSEK